MGIAIAKHSVRIVIGILCACITLFFSGCESQKTIINGLEERDANEILVFLASKGIPAYKVKAKSEAPGGGSALVLYDILVSSESAPEAMAILNANGLPRRRTQKLLELFAAGGLVPSEMQEKIRYEAGRAEEIAGTIRKIDGILDADVQLSFPQEDPLNPKVTKGEVTASVFIKHQGVLDDPNSQLIPKIRRLVSSSIQGLNYENVTIIADRARFSNPAEIEARLNPANLELVRIWTIPIVKQSATRFQIIFVTLISLVFIFLLTTIWMVWKILPIARECGGLSKLFSWHQLVLPEVSPEKGASEAEEEETSAQEKAKKVQENVES